MQRRSVFYALLGLAPAAQAFQEAASSIPATAAEAVSMGLPRFYSQPDFAAFAELGQALIPAFDGRPGAKEAEAAEFLDFLIGQSPADIQALYKQGLATYKVRRKAGLDAALKELGEPWSHAGPTTPYAKFLQAAKQAFYQATVNSRQWSEAMSGRSRSAAGVGSYWMPIE
ncbi:MAG: hypothetical protein NTW74_19280 [Acidobacteria bacterium]|nr:hypothetical protein [Acidobacteriota bacterium]